MLPRALRPPRSRAPVDLRTSTARAPGSSDKPAKSTSSALNSGFGVWLGNNNPPNPPGAICADNEARHHLCARSMNGRSRRESRLPGRPPALRPRHPQNRLRNLLQQGPVHSRSPVASKASAGSRPTKNGTSKVGTGQLSCGWRACQHPVLEPVLGDVAIAGAPAFARRRYSAQQSRRSTRCGGFGAQPLTPDPRGPGLIPAASRLIAEGEGVAQLCGTDNLPIVPDLPRLADTAAPGAFQPPP